jgi:two-component system, cell cycle sensor histidine kinase and response regulator CckA
LLLDEQLNETTRLRLERIDQAATRSAGITQQLLSFSRASDENETILDFNQVIREAGELVKRSLMSKVELLLAPADSPLKVRMDATRAHQVLLNLCLNAQDAMPDGGRLTLGNALVQLTSEQAARMHIAGGADFLRSSVTDTGVGIPSELVARIFDPFFTTKAKGKGTGLGLSIVHSVITQAGGFLEIKSTPGQGTTFHIYLPIVDANLSSAAPTTQASLLKGTGRILVVDDLDLVQDFTRTFLKSAGYEVLVASSAEEALEILENQAGAVDLLFTDYNMPGKSGRQLIHETYARWPQMKFILVSGYLEESDRQQIEKDYGAQILNKPFHIAEAATLVARMFGTVSHRPSE